ncbi:MAG: neutral/alkaline non-lysosomal ceramidase N-terminal domain-containing protein [Planctomycetaceae bacterium]
MSNLLQRVLSIGLLLVILATVTSTAAHGGFKVGLARQDATPGTPVRLSGYGNRDKPSEGVDTPLNVRAMALRHDDGPVHLLLSVDSIGFSAGFVQKVAQQLEHEHGIARSRLAVCSTHSHTSPHPATGLDNLFATPLSPEELQAAEQYTAQLEKACVEAAGKAISALQPARLQLVQGRATFARNRRVIKDGVWKGFGVNPDGPVDHRLPVLVISSPDGDKLRGVVFNYACHCTTFGGDYNRVNGDWAGYAAEYLEAAHPEMVALCTIGCGADQNPDRDSKRALEIAQIQGHEIADETSRLLKEGTRLDLSAAPVASFGYAGLPIDRPSNDDLTKALEDKSPQVRRHAETMLATFARMGRLPESYPMPIQVWRFGDELAMVFLGGEVCVDYEYRIRRELEPKLTQQAPDATGVPSRVMVTAYANDVFGYVAPERMRSEGGYEVDFSMIYYMQPGRWSSGTEDAILRRVHELFEQPAGGEALSVNDALKTFTLPKGLAIDVVAAEPLVRDPINMAVDATG